MTVLISVGDRVRVDDAACDSYPGVWVVVAVRATQGGPVARITPYAEQPEGLRLAEVPLSRLSLEPPF